MLKSKHRTERIVTSHASNHAQMKVAHLKRQLYYKDLREGFCD